MSGCSSVTPRRALCWLSSRFLQKAFRLVSKSESAAARNKIGLAPSLKKIKPAPSDERANVSREPAKAHRCGRGSVIGFVKLDAIAPGGGAAFTFTSFDTAAVTLPAEVRIPVRACDS